MARKKNWIKGAIKRPGAFRAKARRAGMSTQAYARKERNAPGRLGKQARLAATLGKLRKGGKRKARKATRRKAARRKARKR